MSINLEMASQAFLERAKWLDITVRPVNLRFTMSEVHVRNDEFAAFVQQFAYFGELLFLEFAHVFKEPLGDNNVKFPLAELDRRL